MTLNSPNPSDWLYSVWDGNEFRYVSRQRVDQWIHPEANSIRVKRYQKSDKRKAVQRRYYIKRWKNNEGRPLNETD